MTIEEAMYILKNAAFLGTNEERDKMERAVELVEHQLEYLQNECRRKDTNIAHLTGKNEGLKQAIRIFSEEIAH